MSINFSRRSFFASASSAAAALCSPSLVTPAAAKNSWKMTQGIRDSRVEPATRWLLEHYGETFQARLANTPISLPLVCAIVCQESAYTWFDRSQFVQGRSADQMMRLLILDNVSPRGQFPRDTQAFLADRRFSDIATDLLKICDESRVARGYQATGKLLFGYGLFQYDLQNIESDPSFWRDSPANGSDGKVRGLWGDVGACTDRFVRLFERKLKSTGGDLKAAITAYNGRGENAARYAEIVLKFCDLAAAEVTKWLQTR